MLQSFSTLTQDLVSRTFVEECVSKELVCHRFLHPSLSTTKSVHHIYHDACKFYKAILGQSLQVCLPREILVSCQLHSFLTLLELLLSILRPVTWRGKGDLLQLPWAVPPKGCFLLVELWSGMSGLAIAMLAVGMHFYGAAAECARKRAGSAFQCGSFQHASWLKNFFFVKNSNHEISC